MAVLVILQIAQLRFGRCSPLNMNVIIHVQNVTKRTLFLVKLSIFSIISSRVEVTGAPPLRFGALFRLNDHISDTSAHTLLK